MNDLIKTSIEGAVAILRLNRPEAINALNPEMMASIHQKLTDWAADDSISLVVFEGEGKRGFCAGGDVRWTRSAVLEGRAEQADAFFALEYSVNKMIATYPKPLAALTHGAVMGGGIGLAGHAKYRFTHEGSRFAMPETAIGFFCDVGAQSLLAAVPRQRALMFMLSGDVVGAADAVALNLADRMVKAEEFKAFGERIVDAGNDANAHAALQELVGEGEGGGGRPEFCLLADTHADCFEPEDCSEIIGRLVGASQSSEALNRIVHLIQTRCPTSMWVHVLSRKAATADSEISAVLARDLRLAHLMVRRDDFAEGVRAVLVDKDRSPRWQPEKIADVDQEEIIRALAG
ncbi:MAG TPA: enoyl-CoA hydratase/isomerase family protein [Devosia sp.]|nr:enoyl-CoA hydratase/isomerase family protein [Devosia sp.]